MKTAVLKICGKTLEENEKLANLQIISENIIAQDFKRYVGIKSTEDDFDYEAQIIL